MFAVLAAGPVGTVTVKAPPPPAVVKDLDFIRRTHSDTRNLGKTVLSELYSDKAHEPPKVQHVSPAASSTPQQASKAPVATPTGLHRRVAASLIGHPTLATYKR